MKTAGVYFQVGETFLDSDLNVKAECVETANFGCEDCIYYLLSCDEKNTPKCLPDERKDKTDTSFIKID